MDLDKQDLGDIPPANPPELDKSQEAVSLNIPPSYQDGLNMLEHLLHDKSTVYTSKILTLMLTYKIKADDPIFLLLLCISELELILVNTPLTLTTFGNEMLEEMELLFQKYFGEDTDTHERFETANAEYMAMVAKRSDKIIDSLEQRQFYGNVGAIARTILPAFGSLLLAFGLGVFGTLHLVKADTRALVGSGKLTPEQYQSLKWAESKEGELAKQIIDLNSAKYIGKPCQKAAQNLALKFSYGNQELEKGFCVLLIENPF